MGQDRMEKCATTSQIQRCVQPLCVCVLFDLLLLLVVCQLRHAHFVGMSCDQAFVRLRLAMLCGPFSKFPVHAATQSVYEKLGHAEVVQVSVSGNPTSNPKAGQEFRMFADTYFRQFR